MLGLLNRQTNGRKHRKLAQGRHSRREVRPAFHTRLRLEPLEDRRLLSVTAIWTGLGGDHFWNNAANWNVLPVAGDNLSFPSGPTQTSTVNNFGAGMNFGSIDIAGDNYSLTGSQVFLGGDITSAGSNNSIGLGLQLAADHSITNASTSGATLTVSGGIDLNNHNLSLAAANSSAITEVDGMIGDTSVADTGGLIISGSGQVVLTAHNTYAGLTEVTNYSNLVVENDSALGATAAGTQLDYDATLQLEGGIAITGEALNAGTYDTISSVGANVWTGDMTSGNQLLFDVAGGNSLEVDGNITANYLYNNNSGQLTLDGLGNVIQYDVENYGILEVDGTLTIEYGSVFNWYSGTLQGTGTVNGGDSYEPVYNYGTLTPGTSGTPGILTTNYLDIGSGGNLNVLLNGDTTAGTDYSQLAVTGDVNLYDANLNITLGYTPGATDSYVIVNNQGSDPIDGTFNGLPQGALLLVGSDVFQISYTGGTGNDVVLTHVAADVWTGADGGAGDWSDPNNWAADAIPKPGDNLIFPDGADQTTNFNDFTGAASAFGTIQISGSNYDLTGNALSLGGNIISTGNYNSVDLASVQLSANAGISSTGYTVFAVSSPIDLNGYNLSVNAANSSSSTELDGIISDSSLGDTGGLMIGGSGTSILNNANTYAGLTTVNSGTLVVENAQGLGTTAAGTDVENFATLELAGGIIVAGKPLTSSSSAEISSVGDNVWNGGITVTNYLEVYVNGGNSLEVDGNITGNYLNNNESGLLILGGPANVIQSEVQNSGVLEVDGTLSTSYYGVYNYSTLQGTGTLNGVNAYLYNYGTLKPGLTSSSSAGHP